MYIPLLQIQNMGCCDWRNVFHFHPSSVQSSGRLYPPASMNARNSPLVTRNSEASNDGTLFGRNNEVVVKRMTVNWREKIGSTHDNSGALIGENTVERDERRLNKCFADLRKHGYKMHESEHVDRTVCHIYLNIYLCYVIYNEDHRLNVFSLTKAYTVVLATDSLFFEKISFCVSAHVEKCRKSQITPPPVYVSWQCCYFSRLYGSFCWRYLQTTDVSIFIVPTIRRKIFRLSKLHVLTIDTNHPVMLRYTVCNRNKCRTCEWPCLSRN